MNEIIRELSEEAREFATIRHSESNLILAIDKDVYEQKFAELIIEECVHVCNEPLKDMPHFKQVGVEFGELLLRHFGFE